MIVIIETLTPILLLPVINDSTDNFALVASSASTAGVRQVQYAALKLIVRLGVPKDLAIIPLQLVQTVVPVNRHGQGITYKET
jgi:hypothetical protein